VIRLDPQQNLISVVLLGAIAAAVVAGALNFLFLGSADVDSIEPVGDSMAAGVETGNADLELGDLSRFAAITDRPVFFEDRQLPVLRADADAEPDQAVAEVEPEVEIPELGALVAGIIITPDMKIAMISDQETNETLVLREGMTLAGDKSAWRLAEIRPRGVRFSTDAGQQRELELAVETEALQAGSGGQRRTARAEPAEQGAEPSEAENEDAQQEARERAEEIRRRVAERRAQLRAEAERRARDQQNDG